jgi:hypothetical protein
MKTEQSEFKIRFRKRKAGGKILYFNPNQLDKYRTEVKCDFVFILLNQLKIANNCEITLDYDLQILGDTWIKEFNENNSKVKTTLLDLHHHRAIMEYCKQNVHISCISDFKLICELLENHYKMRGENE